MPVATVSSGYSTLLARGIAAAFDTWEIGTYREPGDPYQAGDALPIYLGSREPAPIGGIDVDERLQIIPRDGLSQPNGVVDTPVTLNWRGPVGGAWTQGNDMLDYFYLRLHKLSHFQFGDIRIGRVLRQSAGLLGSDTKGRQLAVAVYVFRGFNRSVNE